MSVSIGVPASLTRGPMMALPPLQVGPGGGFIIAGIVPGPYRVATTEGLRSPLGAWWLKSVLVNGGDILDTPLNIRQGADGNGDVLGPGGYTIHNLPPGEYLVVASDDVEPGRVVRPDVPATDGGGRHTNYGRRV